MSDNAVKQITADDLRRMDGQDGLILQGCGGDPQEWVDGVNDLLTEAGILLDGSKFPAESVSVFQHDGLTNMLFPFEDVKLDMGRLAVWRLQTHETFGGTWLSVVVAKSAPLRFRLSAKTAFAPLLLLSPPNPLCWVLAGAPWSPNRLGGYEQVQQKPQMQLLGEDSNIFAILGRASRLLNRAGMKTQGEEMFRRVTACEDYNEALNIISEYVDTELSGHTQSKKYHQKKGHDIHER